LLDWLDEIGVVRWVSYPATVLAVVDSVTV
jgi:hypothetical protein